ncbi:hypothetical protein TEA_027868 [Camellia sinensis var. sinensis]|uniref:Uncharacterized protein n=1 Tax=Camellia sinensis var. sinensis TaxID=542762 RepID=A0A4S4D9G4_CAMSN|nr:hypothetical protein TEA_027868 [Camellia sinensis var. sinensis]
MPELYAQRKALRIAGTSRRERETEGRGGSSSSVVGQSSQLVGRRPIVASASARLHLHLHLRLPPPPPPPPALFLGLPPVLFLLLFFLILFFFFFFFFLLLKFEPNLTQNLSGSVAELYYLLPPATSDTVDGKVLGIKSRRFVAAAPAKPDQH